MRLLAVPLLLVALAPAVVGQSVLTPTLEVAIDAPSDPVAASGVVRVPYAVTWKLQGPATGTVTVTLEAGASDGAWATDADPREHTFELAPGVEHAHVLAGALLLSAERAAAFEPTTVTLTATSSSPSPVVAGASGSGEASVAADWRPGLHVVLQQPAVAMPPGGGEGVALAEIRNTGNAPTNVAASVTGKPKGCTAAPDGPSAWTLAPDERRPAKLKVACSDGWTEGALTVAFAQRLAADAARAAPSVEAQWDVGGPSTGAREYGDPPRNDAPGLAPLATLVAGVAAARAARSRNG